MSKEIADALRKAAEALDGEKAKDDKPYDALLAAIREHTTKKDADPDTETEPEADDQDAKEGEADGQADVHAPAES